MSGRAARPAAPRPHGDVLRRDDDGRLGRKAIGNAVDVLARISYQRFFRRYLRVAGMTGTAREVARELWAVYHLPVVTIPTNRPVQRRRLPDEVYLTAEEKWADCLSWPSRWIRGGSSRRSPA